LNNQLYFHLLSDKFNKIKVSREIVDIQKKRRIQFLQDFTSMGGTTDSNENIQVIDLTNDEDIKEEPIIEDQSQPSTCQYTFRILIQNEVSLLHPRSLLIFFHQRMKRIVHSLILRGNDFSLICFLM
jgi:hypothetical protein